MKREWNTKNRAEAQSTQRESQQITAPADVVEDFVSFLEGQDWLTAAQILAAREIPVTEARKRQIRAIAEASEGKICCGQLGYKLTTAMTLGEYHHFRNWMRAQSAKMQHRVIMTDKVFFSRKNIIL